MQQLFMSVFKLQENLDKFIVGVDQRLGELEKVTRELYVNQKNQKEILQQQYTQIFQKLNQIQGGSVAEPNVNHATTTLMNEAPLYKTLRDKEQEDLDAQLARKIQAQLDIESNPSVPTPPPSRFYHVTDEEACPLCRMKMPSSLLEQHVNEVHFANEAEPPKMEEKKDPNASWLSKLFGFKAEEKKNENIVAQTSTPSKPTTTNTPPNTLSKTGYSFQAPYVFFSCICSLPTISAIFQNTFWSITTTIL